MNLIGKLQPVIIITAALIGLLLGAVTPFGSVSSSLIEVFLMLLLYILSLAIAVVTFPEQPLASLALVIGPLIELPVLSVISGILKRWNQE